MKKQKLIMPILCSTAAIGAISTLASCSCSPGEDTPIDPKIGEFTKLDTDFTPTNEYEMTSEDIKWGIDSYIGVKKYFEKINETNGQAFIDDTVWRMSRCNLVGFGQYIWFPFVNLLPNFQVKVNNIEVEPTTRIIKNLSYTWKNTENSHFSKYDFGGNFEITLECSNIQMDIVSGRGGTFMSTLQQDYRNQELSDIKIKLNASGNLIDTLTGNIDFGEKTTFGEKGDKTIVDFMQFLGLKNEAWQVRFMGILMNEFGIEFDDYLPSNVELQLGLPTYYLKDCITPLGWTAVKKEDSMDAKFALSGTNYIQIDKLSFPIELNPLFSEMDTDTSLWIDDGTFYLNDGTTKSIRRLVEQENSTLKIVKNGEDYVVELTLKSEYMDAPLESDWMNVTKLVINEIHDDDDRKYTYVDSQREDAYFTNSIYVDWTINLTKQ